jgi:hypothetical protein
MLWGLLHRCLNIRWHVSPCLALAVMVLPLLAYMRAITDLQAGLAKQVDRTKTLSWEMGRQHQTLVLMNAVRHESDERLRGLRRQLNDTESQLGSLWNVYHKNKIRKAAYPTAQAGNKTYECTCPLKVPVTDYWQFDCSLYDDQISYDLSRWLPQGISTKLVEETYDKYASKGLATYLLTIDKEGALFGKWSNPHPKLHEGFIRQLQTTMQMVSMASVSFVVVLGDRPVVSQRRRVMLFPLAQPSAVSD